MSVFSDALARHRQTMDGMDALESQTMQMADAIRTCLGNGGKLLFFGNGGSAADAQHLATEFVVRYKAERQPLAALALTTDSSALTAHGNDYSFATLFDRQLQALARPGDIAIGISTSGTSPNIISALKTARAQGCLCCALTGNDGGQLPPLTDHCLIVPSTETARIQEAHIFLGHCLCESMEPTP